MGCEESRKLAQKSLDKALTEAEKKSLDEHLSRCVECRRYLAQIRSLGLLLQGALSKRFDGYAERVVERVIHRRRRVVFHTRWAMSIGALAAVLLVALILFLCGAFERASPIEIMRVGEATGVEVKEGAVWRMLNCNEPILSGSILRNMKEHPSALLTEGGSSVVLNKGTSVKLEKSGSGYSVRLLEGDLLVTSNKEKFFVYSDGVEVINRGTQFAVHRGLFYVLVVVMEGEVECRAAQRSVIVRAGEQSRVTLQGFPEPPSKIKEEEAKKAWYIPIVAPSETRPQDTEKPPLPLDLPIKKPEQK